MSEEDPLSKAEVLMKAQKANEDQRKSQAIISVMKRHHNHHHHGHDHEHGHGHHHHHKSDINIELDEVDSSPRPQEGTRARISRAGSRASRRSRRSGRSSASGRASVQLKRLGSHKDIEGLHDHGECKKKFKESKRLAEELDESASDPSMLDEVQALMSPAKHKEDQIALNQQFDAVYETMSKIKKDVTQLMDKRLSKFEEKLNE